MSLKFKQIFFVQNEIKKVLDLALEEREIEIRKLAKELGCPLDSLMQQNILLTRLLGVFEMQHVVTENHIIG